MLSQNADEENQALRKDVDGIKKELENTRKESEEHKKAVGEKNTEVLDAVAKLNEREGEIKRLSSEIQENIKKSQKLEGTAEEYLF